MTDKQSMDFARCPTCGPTATEPHTRRPGVARCVNCKEWLSGPKASADELAATVKAAYEMGRADERERCLLAAADEMEAVIADGDVAEVAAPVAGEVGRSACVSARDALYEEPHEWLRKYAATETNPPVSPKAVTE